MASQIVCRDAELAKLRHLLLQPSESTLNFAHLWGPPGCGKTLLARAALNGLPHLWLTCTEAGSIRQLIDFIFHLSGNAENKGLSATDWAESFSACLRPGHWLALDDAERLTEAADGRTLAALLRIRQLTGSRLLLIGRLPWTSYARGLAGAAASSAYCIHLPAYDKSQLASIVARVVPGCDYSLAQLAADTAYSVTRQPAHIAEAAAACRAAYSKGGWSSARPILGACLRGLLTPLTSPTTSSGDAVQQDQHFADLPLLSRFLLLAAHLCTRVHPSNDRRLFAFNAGRRQHRRKPKKASAASSAAAMEALASRPVPLERLLNICRVISRDSGAYDSSAALPCLADLIRLGFLASGAPVRDRLAAPRFRCLLAEEAALRLAKLCEFSLAAYVQCE